MGSAIAMTDCAVLRIDKKAMMEALHRESVFSDMFVAYLLARNVRRRSVGSAFQFEREEAGSDPFTARSFRQGRHTRDGSPQDQSGDAGGDDRHTSLAGQLLHEPVQKTGLHSLQWRTESPQFTAQCSSARLAVLPTRFTRTKRGDTRVKLNVH
jgi:hypothetical protein